MPDAVPDEIRHVPLDEIDIFSGQSREDFDDGELDKLADSIKTDGILQAGIAWLDPGRNRYVLVAGERRFRAAKRAGLAAIPVKVLRGNRSQGELLRFNLVENLLREELNPIERAKAFRRYMQLEGLNASEVATRLNVSNAMVSRDLALLDLPESLQERVASGTLPPSVGSTIARLDDDTARRDLADRYAAGAITRDGVAKAVKQGKGRGKGSKPLRLAVKLSGLSVSVAGKADRLTLDTLSSVFGRLAREAKSLKDAGKTEPAELAAVLKAAS